MSTLQNRSVVELRSIAQGLGVSVQFSWDKKKLLQYVEEALENLDRKKPPKDRRVRHLPTQSARPVCTQAEVSQVLERYALTGLEYEFTEEGVALTHTRVRKDSCSLKVPIAVIIETARKLIYD